MSKSPLLSKLGFCPLNEGKRMREFASFLCLLDWNKLRKHSLNIVLLTFTFDFREVLDKNSLEIKVQTQYTAVKA